MEIDTPYSTVYKKTIRETLILPFEKTLDSLARIIRTGEIIKKRRAALYQTKRLAFRFFRNAILEESVGLCVPLADALSHAAGVDAVALAQLLLGALFDELVGQADA